MNSNLPPRPNLDHLRRQAKELLAALQSGDAGAAETIRQNLPAANGMTAEQILKARYRLADAQSAIARKSGFAAWPHLARYVEQLRALEGTWTFARLEIDGSTIPAAALGTSRILIDGDRFRTESPDATYEGLFDINVEAQPHEIDIEFVAGPEAGNWNYGIFRLDGDRLEICLDMHGKPRPRDFATTAGSGHACETLTRASGARPENVTGGTAPVAAPPAPTETEAAFPYVESPTLTRLQGEWKASKIVRDGQALPKMILWTARRSAKQNEVKISVGGQTIIHALVRLDEGNEPIHVDYYSLSAASKGSIQLGLMKWVDEEACFCMAAPGQPRPADFTSTPGSGNTLSQWQKK